MLHGFLVFSLPPLQYVRRETGLKIPHDVTANLRGSLKCVRKTYIHYHTVNIVTLIILLLSIVKVYVSLENFKELKTLVNIN